MMEKRKPTDFFLLNNLIEFEDLSPIDFVNRDFTNVETDLMLPVGTTVTYKKGDANWVLIDYVDDWYMFALANTTENLVVYEKGTDNILGYTFQAFKVRASEFNKIFGFDKATGITPPNSLGVLSNIAVVNIDGVFQYRLDELPKFIVKHFSPCFMKLLESILICFSCIEPAVALETKWDKNNLTKVEITKFELTEIKYPDDAPTLTTASMWDALVGYIPILRCTGEFVDKQVVEVRT